MDFSSISTSSIDQLRCTICQNYLSYFPIKVCLKTGNICGRCVPPEDAVIVSNIPFETLSQFVLFPCRYKPQGCEREFRPKSIPEHEKNCKFRVISCICEKFASCTWKGQRAESLSHCKKSHAELFMTEKVRLENSETFNLLQHDDMILILRKDVDPIGKTLNFEMYSNEFEMYPKTYSCQLNVRNGAKNLNLNFATTTSERSSPNELNLESLDENADIFISVKIGDVISDPAEEVNVEMLQILECFVCKEYAVPPIFHCVQSSETLCQDCKDKHSSSCTSCRDTKGARNINLDKIAQLLNYPCKYSDNGCTHVCKPENIKNHQLRCEFGTYKCPLADFEICDWTGLYKDMEEHIQENHQELVTNCSEISKQLTPGRNKCDIIKFAGVLFRLVCKATKKPDNYYWSVEVLGPFCDDFKFEILLVDPRQTGRKLLIRQKCSFLKNIEDLFKDGDCCYFNKDQMEDFVVDGVVTFKVHIFV